MSRAILSLVAPCLNEQDNVSILAKRFFDAAEIENIKVEIVFVDDGSTDLTWERISHVKSEYKDSVVAIRHATNRGIPQGWISGVEAAQGEFVCLIDSDLQNPPESVFRLLAAFDGDDASIVRGIRRAVKGQPASRILMSRTLNWILNFTFGMKSADNKSGFILGLRESILRIVLHTGHYKHYQTFIGVAANAHGFKVTEIDTPFEDRRSGISFLSGKSFSVVKDVFADFPEARREFGSRFHFRRKA